MKRGWRFLYSSLFREGHTKRLLPIRLHTSFALIETDSRTKILQFHEYCSHDDKNRAFFDKTTEMTAESAETSFLLFDNKENSIPTNEMGKTIFCNLLIDC